MHNETLAALLWFTAVFLASGALVTITSIGKPREPLSSAVAAWVVAVSALIATVAVLAALALG